MPLTKPSPVTEYYGQTWWDQQADWMKQYLEAQSSMIQSAEDAQKQLESIKCYKQRELSYRVQEQLKHLQD